MDGRLRAPHPVLRQPSCEVAGYETALSGGRSRVWGLAVRWPVSRVLSRFPGDGYSSSAAVAGNVEQPTRTSVQDRTCRAGRRVSLHGLAPDGVYHARPVAGPAVRSYRTFSPLPAVRCWGRRSVFCGTFPGVAPAGRYPAPLFHGARTFLEPPPFGELRRAAARPTGSALISEPAHECQPQTGFFRTPTVEPTWFHEILLRDATKRCCGAFEI